MQPGHNDLVAFATEERLRPLVDDLAAILGRRVRVTMESSAPARQDGEPGQGSAAPSAPANLRRQAMGLPLVKKLFDVFSDASLIDVRPEPQPDEAPAPPPQPDADEDEADLT